MKKAFFFLLLYSSIISSQSFNGNLGTQTLFWNMEQKDFALPPRVGITPMSIKLWDNYLGPNSPSRYGTLLEINGRESHLISQLYFDNNWEGGKILYRSAFYSQNTWDDWRYLLDSKSNVQSSGSLKIEGNENSYILNGNIGIGTSNPEKKMQINGLNTDAALRIHANEGNNNTNTPYLLLTGGYLPNNGVALRGVGDLNYGRKALVFYSGWEGNLDNPTITDLQERMRISSNGNVGIGTTNPASKLTVAGNIHSREVKVSVDAGADFVFENDYNLPSLDSVADFIQKNKHLPEIASAKEMQKDGINLSEMNMKLLQKIEEMTLYMIQQNKESNNQKEEIIKLKKDNTELELIKSRLLKLEEKK